MCMYCHMHNSHVQCIMIILDPNQFSLYQYIWTIKFLLIFVPLDLWFIHDINMNVNPKSLTFHPSAVEILLKFHLPYTYIYRLMRFRNKYMEKCLIDRQFCNFFCRSHIQPSVLLSIIYHPA